MTPGEVGRSAFRFRRAAARSLLPIALSLVLAGCASSPVDNEPRARVHVVQRGETLYAIASRYGLDYRDVARWNRLRDPDMIYVGQRLRLFPSSASTTSRAAAASRSTRGASSAGKGASSARSPAPP
ncbi:MAG TPA: LysM domain-containing protein, partial [Gammaproteobacteria bacterium]|nr:LysM domain-containing protein [Gammaproteobacteria bacterium]